MKDKEQVQEAGGSLDDRIHTVRSAWYKQYGDDPSSHTYVVDVFEDVVVVKTGGFGDISKYYQVAYSIGEDSVDFAEPTAWVEVELSYTPAAGGTGEATEEADTPDEDGQILESIRAVIESNGRGPEAVIIVEGESANERIYTRQALNSGVAVFSGAKLFVDHPTAFEESQRPERSVRDVVGVLGEAYLSKDRAGRTALRAPVIISESEQGLMTKIREGILGDLSIRAYGRGKANDDGKFVVESFVASPHTSVDFVTVAAAGGYAELAESAPVQPELPLEEEENEEGDTMTEADSSQIVMLREANEKLQQENRALKAEKRAAEAQAALTRLIPASLPDAVQRMLRERAKPLVAAYAESDDDADALTAALKKVIEAERAYLAKVLPGGVVSGLSGPQSSSAVDADEELEEAFRDLVPEETLDIALRGRA